MSAAIEQPPSSAAATEPAAVASGCPMASHKGYEMVYKPTYASLIAMAIHASPEKRLMLNEIYNFIQEHRTLVPTATCQNWKNSVRHNLSLRKCFRKIPRWDSGGKKLSAHWVLDYTCLPIAAQSVVDQLDKFGPVPFPERFLTGDQGSVASAAAAPARTTLGGPTPEASEESEPEPDEGSQRQPKRIKRSPAPECPAAQGVQAPVYPGTTMNMFATLPATTAQLHAAASAQMQMLRSMQFGLSGTQSLMYASPFGPYVPYVTSDRTPPSTPPGPGMSIDGDGGDQQSLTVPARPGGSCAQGGMDLLAMAAAAAGAAATAS